MGNEAGGSRCESEGDLPATFCLGILPQFLGFAPKTTPIAEYLSPKEKSGPQMLPVEESLKKKKFNISLFHGHQWTLEIL